MRNRLTRRPSPAMLVAMTALVSSFAGPAAADEVARIAQSLTSSNQIKNGIVTSADVKNESLSTTDILNGGIRTEDIGTSQVTTSDLGPDSIRGDKIQSNTIDGSDVQDNTLKGEDILESALGTVPRAENADNAARLDGRSASAFTTSTEVQSFSVALDLGETEEIASSGAIKLIAGCEDDGGGSATARIYATTTQAGSLLESDEDSFSGGSDPAANPADYLQPDTPPEDAEIITDSSSSTFPESVSEIDGGFAIAPDGSYAGIDAEGTGQAFNVDGGRCFFAGNVRTNS